MNLVDLNGNKYKEELPLYLPCGYIRGLFAKYQSKQNTNDIAQKLQSVFINVEEDIDFTDQSSIIRALKEAKKKDLITDKEIEDILKSQTLNAEKITSDTNDTLELFKSIIIVKNIIDKDLAENVKSDIDSDFWQFQNFEEIQNCLNSFRRSLNI